jgi:hypothetical protein
MYTHFYCRGEKLQSPVMAPRKVSKASTDVSGQGYDISDTSPRRIDCVRTYSYVSEVLQSQLVNYLDNSSDNETDDMTTKYKIIV